MSITSAGRPLTVQEYESLEEPDDAWVSELVRGRVVREPPLGYRHARLQARIAGSITEFVNTHGLGVVLTEVGVVRTESPPAVRGPDVAFLAQARVPPDDPPGFLRVPPDLVVEIVSPSDRLGTVLGRILDYVDAGVGEAWVVDPESRTVTILRSRSDVRIVGEGDDVTDVAALPGFSMGVSELLD